VKITLGFDVYGTLVDPSGMAKHLAHDLGVEAANFADFWREKQLEYSFRRGLMQNYADFSICTSDALDFTCQRFKSSSPQNDEPSYWAYTNICRHSMTSYRRSTTSCIPSLRLFQWKEKRDRCSFIEREHP
jgi:FMN phosphatase YigB (HAD superfamily)